MEAVLSAPDSFADVQCSELLQSATHEKGDAKENCCHHWLPRRWQPLQRREESENQSNVSLLPTTEAKESVKLGEQKRKGCQTSDGNRHIADRLCPCLLPIPPSKALSQECLHMYNVFCLSTSQKHVDSSLLLSLVSFTCFTENVTVRFSLLLACEICPSFCVFCEHPSPVFLSWQIQKQNAQCLSFHPTPPQRSSYSV